MRKRGAASVKEAYPSFKIKLFRNSKKMRHKLTSKFARTPNNGDSNGERVGWIKKFKFHYLVDVIRMF